MRLRYAELPSKEAKLNCWSEPLVKDLMTTEVLTMNENDSLKALDDMMKWKSIRHVPVVDDWGSLVGLVTQRDFLKIAVSKLSRMTKEESDNLYSNIKIRDVMGRKVVAISPETPVSAAAQTMLEHKYGCLPVLEEGRLVGIITEADFVKVFTRWSVEYIPGAA